MKVVRYVTPFAPAGFIPAWQAAEHLERERRRWALLQELDMLSDAQRAIGPPRIEEAPADTLGLDHEEREMGDKSPKKTEAKKPKLSLKEKRAAKHEKERDVGMLGSH